MRSHRTATELPRWFGGIIVATMVGPISGCGVSDRAAISGKSNATAATADAARPKVQTELEKIAGKWTALSMRVDGIRTPVTEWYRYSFDGDRMTTETSEAGPTAVKFHLDPATNPKTLDTSIIADGVEEISKGIYSIEGDILRLSWRVGGERPTDFTSQDGDEKIVLVLQRAVD